MRNRWVVVCATSVAGCISTPGVHPTLHPSVPGSGPSAGVALGALVQHANDDTSANIGYGEGWARLGPTGALELRTTPQAAFVAYDIPLSDGTTSLSLRPSFGLSVIRFTTTTTIMGMVMKETQTTASVHPGATLVIQSGSLYAAPRIGFGRSEPLSDRDTNDGSSAYSVAGTVGFRIDPTFTLELTAVYSRNFDEPEPDSVWTFVPTLGVSVGK